MGRQRTVLVMRRPCSQYVWSRPILLHLPTPCFPITPSQVVVFRPTLALKVKKNGELVGVGDGVDDIVDILIELVFSLIWVGQSRSINTDNGCKLSSSEG